VRITREKSRPAGARDRMMIGGAMRSMRASYRAQAR
jgi:hypothetical protein